MLEVAGVLPVDKPCGPTSHDIVNRIRRTFRIDKVGHGGTLDPNATGLLLILLGTILLISFTALALQGKELTDYVVDSRGIHETHYLPDPTPLKLITRLKPLSLLREGGGGSAPPVLKLGEKDLPWKNVARVQLWPEKCMILYYAPAWWMRIAAACTPFTWEDVMGLTREKLGKKKKIRLPASLVIPPEQRTRRSVSRPAPNPLRESEAIDSEYS